MKTRTTPITSQCRALALGLAIFNLSAASVIQFSATTYNYNVKEGTGQVEIIVQRTNNLDTVVSVDFATTNVSATAGLDYLDVATNLTFAVGETSQTVAVPLLSDGLVEGIETFQAWLSNPSNGAILGLRTNATVRITDNDQGLKLDTSTYTVNEDSGSVEIGILRGDDGDSPITVDLTTADDTAIVGVDYVGVTNTIQIAAREVLKRVSIPILNDGILESSKTFRVTLTNLTGGNALGSPSSATVTISDADQKVQLEFASYYAGEGTEFVRIGVVRGESDAPGTVEFQTMDVSTTAGLDYVGLTNTLSFDAGERLKLIDIPILNDGLKEANEVFRVTLANPTGGALLGSTVSATVSITDNDAGAQFEFADAWVRETEGVYRVGMLRGNDGQLGAFTMDYTTTNQTALAGQDYTETRGTLTFAEGEMVQWLSVPLLCPQPKDPDRKFKILLSNPSGGVQLGVNSNQTVTILGTLGTVPHSFEDLAVLPDQSVRLTLAGGVHRRFKDYYDLYAIDVSVDLGAWSCLAIPERINTNLDSLVFTDSTSANAERRFYRTSAEHRIVPTPPPTGPYPIGVTSRLVQDPARRNRYRISTNGCFMVSVHYPAQVTSGGRPVPWSDNWIPDRAAFGDFVKDTDKVPYLVGRSILEAAGNRTRAPYPVLLMSHGFGGDSRSWHHQKAESLVSHGYVFVTIDHWDAASTRWPDGTILRGSATQASGAGLQDRVADLRFIVDRLAEWNQSDPLLKGMLDLDRIAAMGFSWGGDTAAEFCRTDARCRAVVFFDGGGDTTTEAYRRGAHRPLLEMCSASSVDETFFAKAVRDAIWFQISGTEHNHFGDAYWEVLPNTLASGREAARIINDWAVWFLNRHLKGSTDPMPALADYPRIINFKQK